MENNKTYQTTGLMMKLPITMPVLLLKETEILQLRLVKNHQELLQREMIMLPLKVISTTILMIQLITGLRLKLEMIGRM